MTLPERAARIADSMPLIEQQEPYVLAWSAVYESALSHLKAAFVEGEGDGN